MPTSPARLAANRANALRSTGPRTPIGKAASSRNATQHGLLARGPLLPDEDPAEYEALGDRLLEHLEPAAGTEALLVDDILGLVWRLRRLARVEVALFAVGLHGPLERALAEAGESDAGVGVAFAAQAATFGVLTRYETALVNRLRRSLVDLERLQHVRRERELEDDAKDAGAPIVGFVSQLGRSVRTLSEGLR
jgi:hypothetical protein